MITPTVCRHRGFSLIELTIVLVIVALLSGGLMLSLGSQRDLSLNKENQLQIQSIQEALLGFAMVNGRLPCPADPTLPSGGTAGAEAQQPCNDPSCIAGDMICMREHGVVPWRTLGLKETDAWGNRFTYFAGREFANPLNDAEKKAGLRSRPTLDTPGRATIEDGKGNSVALQIPAVLVGHGRGSGGAYQTSGTRIAVSGGNEQENADDDLTFISRIPSDSFDDEVAWINPSILKSRLVAVGKLP